MLVWQIFKVWRLRGKDAEVRSKIADMALMSFVARQCQEPAQSNAAMMHKHVNVLSFTLSAGSCVLEVCITIEVQKSNILATYRTHPGLQQRFPDFRAGRLRGKLRGSDGSPRSCFEVSLGFGLHCGWAIEALGKLQ